MKHLILIFSATLFLTINVFSQTPIEQEHKDLVEWMSLTEALKKQESQPKKIFMDVYTDWCGWCKVMSKNTFSNPQIAAYINQYFYPVRFDAETIDTLEYLGKTYINKNAGEKRATHDLAYVFTNNRPSYPTITYLDEKGKMIQSIPGYMDVKKIEPFLVYFNENAFKSAPFETFKANFEIAFNDSIEKGKGKIQWVTFEDAEKLIKQDPKPIIIDLYTPWSNTSRVMEATTYTDEYTADYINQYFYAVHFEPTTKDSIFFGGKMYLNKGVGHPFNDLAVVLTNGQIGIPATIYLNEKLELLSNVPGYRSPTELEPILEYFGQAKYKTSNWQDFMTNFKSKMDGQNPNSTIQELPKE